MKHLGKEVTLTIGGKDYTFSRLERREHMAWMDYANKQLGCPLAEARKNMEGFPPHIQEVLFKDALERKKLRSNPECEDYQVFMRSWQGAMKLMQLLLKKHHPDLSEEQVEEVYDQAIEEHGADFLAGLRAEAQGVPPTDPQARKEQALAGDDFRDGQTA